MMNEHPDEHHSLTKFHKKKVSSTNINNQYLYIQFIYSIFYYFFYVIVAHENLFHTIYIIQPDNTKKIVFRWQSIRNSKKMYSIITNK